MSATPSIPPPVTVEPLQLNLMPGEAWEPLPDSDFDAPAARHLLRRAGWTAKPAEVDRLLQDGLAASLDRLFPVKAPSFPMPRSLASFESKAAALQAQLVAANGEIAAAPATAAAPQTPQEVQRQQLRGQINILRNQAEQDLTVRWLEFAGRPENSVTEKWTLFLSDIFVVSQEKVKNPALVYTHQNLLRTAGFGSAPMLAKDVSRSPAMVMYLDLQQSQRTAPNENFARELFELFLLGEGNYTEHDVKESARAFTGYRQAGGVFRFAPAQHDPTPKTIFGRTGNYAGDDVIDLAYAQPAAGRYLAHKLARFYLTDDPLPREHLAALGDWWRTAANYDLRRVAQRFFGSRLFFDPAFRGDYIKSPVQYLLGLVQDLALDVAPIPRRTLAPLRLMDQIPFRPPNVRGWVGGRNWINSGTLAARRQAVETLFAPLVETNLNADELAALDEARAQGHTRFNFTADRLAEFADLPPDPAADRLIEAFLPVPVDAAYRATVRDFLAQDLPVNNAPGARRGGAGADQRRLQRLRNTIITLLQSPEYQLC
jgi:uncharacterized protein (DUF1800 family)